MIWILEICRKIFFDAEKGQDSFEKAIIYMKSTMLFDLCATLPQTASGLSPGFTYLKNIRIYNISLLHYPVELLLLNIFSQRDKHYVKALVYAFATIFQILITLHYLGCLWIYIGSEAFVGHEFDLDPWLID